MEGRLGTEAGGGVTGPVHMGWLSGGRLGTEVGGGVTGPVPVIGPTRGRFRVRSKDRGAGWLAPCGVGGVTWQDNMVGRDGVTGRGSVSG